MANKRKTRKVSKRVTEMWNDSTTVWGKNPELETFWGELASGKKLVLVHKGGIHTYVNMPKKFSAKYQTMMTAFNEDPTVVAILSSNPSQDAYEEYLYPKAKDKSVKYVIDHYARYFKPIMAGDKLRVPL